MRILGSILIVVGGGTLLYFAIRTARYWDWRQRTAHDSDHVSSGWLARAREQGY